MTARAVEAWTLAPLNDFVREVQARLVLLMTPAGQVLAQWGFARALDVMSAAALAAGIIASTATPRAAPTAAKRSMGPKSLRQMRHGSIRVHTKRCVATPAPAPISAPFSTESNLRPRLWASSAADASSSATAMTVCCSRRPESSSAPR